MVNGILLTVAIRSTVACSRNSSIPRRSSVLAHTANRNIISLLQAIRFYVSLIVEVFHNYNESSVGPLRCKSAAVMSDGTLLSKIIPAKYLHHGHAFATFFCASLLAPHSQHIVDRIYVMDSVVSTLTVSVVSTWFDPCPSSSVRVILFSPQMVIPLFSLFLSLSLHFGHCPCFLIPQHCVVLQQHCTERAFLYPSRITYNDYEQRHS